MKRLRILTLVSLILAFVIHYYKKQLYVSCTTANSIEIPQDWYTSEGVIETPEKFRRIADQTYLTYPEWYLVYSPEEQADFLKSNTTTDFNYTNEMNKFWESYAFLSDRIEGKYPYNDEYHTMIGVIGVSTAVEYNARTWYETVLGRLTLTTLQTEEDIFTQQYTQDYADLLHEYAWYEFDYLDKLKSLWTETSFFGANFHRKLERKYVLTSEFILKAIYAKLIKVSSNTMYGEISTKTVIVTNGFTPKMKSNESIELIDSLDSGHYLVSIPRYTAFMHTAIQIADDDVTILEVAGNKSAILLSIIAPTNYYPNETETRTIFEQSLTTTLNKKRIVLVTPVKNLTTVLSQCKSDLIQVEHVYDF